MEVFAVPSPASEMEVEGVPLGASLDLVAPYVGSLVTARQGTKEQLPLLLKPEHEVLDTVPTPNCDGTTGACSIGRCG